MRRATVPCNNSSRSSRSSRDALPRRGGRAERGFTLVELMFTLLVMAILLAVAVPSFLSVLQGQHGTDLANQFAQDMAWAQGEALSGQVVQIVLTVNGSWTTTENGQAVPDHSLSMAQLQADDPGATCTLQPATAGASSSCAATLSFDSLGIVSGAPVGVVQYHVGSSVSSFQVFASGAVVPNPTYAS